MSSILIGGIGKKMTDTWRVTPRKPKIPPKVWVPGGENGWTAALSEMILSHSGWRKVFGLGEQSDSPEVSPMDLQMAASAGWLFAGKLRETQAGGTPVAAVAMDSRPTGPLLAEALAFGLLAGGCRVRALGLLPIPHLAAHVQLCESIHGFAYVSASHNPKGYNGFKFGLGNAKVLHPKVAQVFIEDFRALAADVQAQARVLAAVAQVPKSEIEFLYREIVSHRRESFLNYAKLFSRTTFRRDAVLAGAFKAAGGVVCDMNGSARSVSIDKEILGHLGLKTHFFNERPGDFAHEILPEGASLAPCARELHARIKRGFTVGYVPDCDGDRGNIVCVDPATGQARLLESQEIFSLCVVSELASLVWDGQITYDTEGFPNQRVAVVVNDPTSLRVDRIAEAFGVAVFRAEVGEANIVGLADQLRNKGWFVRIMGEGSNGGNITYPGTVRDPLSTLASVLRLATQPELFRIWCQKSGKTAEGSAEFSLIQVLETLPAFQTTPVGSPRAILSVPSVPQGRVKALFEAWFINQGWKGQKDFLAKEMGVYGWEEVNYEGTEEKRGFGPPFRSGGETGGLKILLKDKAGKAMGFLWLRGSGTEPVFRVMADIQGDDPFHEEYLLSWLTGMLKKVF